MKRSSFMAASIAFMLGLNTVSATTWHVTSNLDDFSTGTLRYIVENASESGDKIVFSAAAQSITLQQGEIEIDHDLSISGPATISGNNASRIFSVGSGVSVDMKRLTLENGRSSSGGAILNAGDITIKQSTLQQNVATSAGATVLTSGGAIHNLSNSSLSVKGCLFDQNSTVIDSTLDTGRGGAISLDANSTVSVKETQFQQNSSARDGGAIFNAGSLSIKDSYFDDNSATFAGGAIANFPPSAELSVTNTSFINNSTSFDGGAVVVNNSATFSDCYFANNSTFERGGAIFVATGTASIKDSIFTLNLAGQQGGAIFILAGASATAKNSSFTGNVAGNGGAIYNGGTLVNKNNSFSNNDPDDIAPIS